MAVHRGRRGSSRGRDNYERRDPGHVLSVLRDAPDVRRIPRVPQVQNPAEVLGARDARDAVRGEAARAGRHGVALAVRGLLYRTKRAPPDGDLVRRMEGEVIAIASGYRSLGEGKLATRLENAAPHLYVRDASGTAPYEQRGRKAAPPRCDPDPDQEAPRDLGGDEGVQQDHDRRAGPAQAGPERLRRVLPAYRRPDRLRNRARIAQIGVDLDPTRERDVL